MFRVSNISQRRGMPPGNLSSPEKSLDTAVVFERYDYNTTTCIRSQFATVEDALAFPAGEYLSWLIISGVHDPAVMEAIRGKLDVHPLILEDIMHAGQRPKVDVEDDRMVFAVLQMLTYNTAEKGIEAEQISLLLFDRLVVTFLEDPGDLFDPVRERLAAGKGLMRKRGTDYLFYALIDLVVDNYFVILEDVREEIEEIEEQTLDNPSPECLGQIYRLKREFAYLRKTVWPLREVVGRLERDASGLIQETTTRFLRDLMDHAILVMESIDQGREVLTSLVDVYLSSVSQHLNSVMKVLTIIATIFIPMTFIAGVYGMNFKFMPELDKIWGYPMAWGIMIAMAVSMLVYFYRKKWL